LALRELQEAVELNDADLFASLNRALAELVRIGHNLKVCMHLLFMLADFDNLVQGKPGFRERFNELELLLPAFARSMAGNKTTNAKTRKYLVAVAWQVERATLIFSCSFWFQDTPADLERCCGRRGPMR